MLARLGVFAGTFGLPAAGAVCGEPGRGEAGATSPDPGRAGQVMDTLGALVDNSLVRADTRGGEPRFILLETIREYALERLRDGGDWAQAHDRHAAYFLALAQPSRPNWTAGGSWPGWTGWKPSTAMCGPRCRG